MRARRAILWIFATVIGLLVAGAGGHFPGSFPIGGGTNDEFSAGAAAFGLFIGALMALPLGTAQWLVLRRRGAGVAWVPLTAIGLGLMHAVGDGAPARLATRPISFGDGYVIAGLFGGIAIGALQTLGGGVPRSRWTLVNAVAWPVGIVGGLALAYATGLMALSGPSGWAQQHAFVAAATGLVVGAATAPIAAAGAPRGYSTPLLLRTAGAPPE